MQSENSIKTQLEHLRKLLDKHQSKRRKHRSQAAPSALTSRAERSVAGADPRRQSHGSVNPNGRMHHLRRAWARAIEDAQYRKRVRLQKHLPAERPIEVLRRLASVPCMAEAQRRGEQESPAFREEPNLDILKQSRGFCHVRPKELVDLTG
jgi:hypothetical protein